jgi:hypothetical protein
MDPPRFSGSHIERPFSCLVLLLGLSTMFVPAPEARAVVYLAVFLRMRGLVIYRLDLRPVKPVASAPASGFSSLVDIVQFVPWQPSAWPEAPLDHHEFAMVLKRIFELSMLMEINNVIDDAARHNGSLEHRGHVVAISLLCALDAISSYGYGKENGKQIPPFIRAHFPYEYRPFATVVLKLYRHAVVHSWNLFEVAITPGNEGISSSGGVISFGLLNFFDALKHATESFLEHLSHDAKLQTKARARYNALRRSAKLSSAPGTEVKRSAKA